MSHPRKRSRPVENVGLKFQKRRKVQQKGPIAPIVLSDENLQWREVAIPERLENAEGFFALEEVDGAAVIKDGNNSRVQIRICGPANRGSQGPSVTQKTLAGKVLPINTHGNSEDEWAGIEDHEDTDTLKTLGNAKNGVIENSARIQDQPRNDKLRKVKDRSRATQMGLHPGISYGILTDLKEQPETDVSKWSSLPLSNDLLSAIASLGFTTPTSIQYSAIPQILQGHDVIGKAVTGSGKTLAYGIPIFELWLRMRRAQHTTLSSSPLYPSALILAPTRELAHQLAKHMSNLVAGCAERPRLAIVTGGLSVHKQLRQLTDADFVVATPGRLWEVMNESQELVAGLKRIQFLVVDEADRILSEGHFKDVEKILDMLDRIVIDDDDNAENGDQQVQETQSLRQTLVFSATFDKGLQEALIGKSRPAGSDMLKNKQPMEYLLKKLSFREQRPSFIDVNPTIQMATALNEAILECGAMQKDLYLYYLLLLNFQQKILVFANSISSVKRLVPLLQNLELPAIALHSTMPQKARLRSLERFSEQRRILVATDVAARGLDIENIDLIVHYHVPRTADMYVHRSGRTARAEKPGKSIMLCSPEEVTGVIRLISKIHSEYQLESIQADRTIVTRLRPRLQLSQKLTDATLAKEKAGTRDDWLRTAAQELGVDYDSDEFAVTGAKNSRGRGAGKIKKLTKAGVVSKGEIASIRAQLKDLLGQRVNLGVSPRYLAGGKVDIDALVDENHDKTFLGRVEEV